MSAAEVPNPSLTAIAAVARNGVIGDGRGLPWHIPEDFAHFKRATMGGVLIMGRRTYESIGTALSGRTTIVVTRDPAWVPMGGVRLTAAKPAAESDPGHPARGYDVSGTVVYVADGVAAALHLLGRYTRRRWWCVGGGQTYRELWPYVTQLDLTEVDAEPEGDVTFPALDSSWSEQSREHHDGFDFVTYERAPGPWHDLLREAALPA